MEFDPLRALRDRLDIIEALLAAIDSWAEISDRIYRAADRSEAIRLLGKPPFSFSEVQATHVVDMRSGHRTVAGRRLLRAERARSVRAIEDLGRNSDA